MDDPKSLMNIGDLAKPFNTLIEKISDAVEGIARPAQVKRIAKAEAEAKKILALADIEIVELHQRALTRFILEESRKQENMETIIQKAAPGITEEAHPERMDKDWIVHFFDKARLISDEEMQKLWARVLAGQANSPGRYSKRTIEILGNLERSDAMLFSNLCRYAIFLNTDMGLDPKPFPLIYDTEAEIYADKGITFAALSHLESLGLIHFNFTGEYVLRKMPEDISVSYFSSPLRIQKSGIGDLKIGKIMVTHVGQELAYVCDAEEVAGFTEYLKNKWKSFGYKIEPDAEQSAPGEMLSTDA